MNDHDSERIRGVLEEHGWRPAVDAEAADLLVFNTCAVREGAESRLEGRLGEARRIKRGKPGLLVALGGCVAQRRQEDIFHELPFIDVAFGPQNIGQLPVLLERAAEGPSPAYAFEDNPVPSADLPAVRVERRRAWVQAMSGCTNYCSYCVVPHVRGPERSRPPDEIEAEVARLAADGVIEITVLGQNVNAYGLDRRGASGSGSFTDFAGLLARLDAIEGIERIRFTTSHPKDLSKRLIEAMRDLPAVCEHLHLPVQSGSTRILKRMKRGYTRGHYLGLVEKLRTEVPDLALTTDIIVGFPGEREDDFHRTMTLAEACAFDGAFTFIFSARPGTEAAEMPGRVPEVTLKRRMEELIELVQRTADRINQGLVGRELEVLVEGPSRAGEGQLRGRTRNNKIVNFRPLPVDADGKTQTQLDASAEEPAGPPLVTVHIESATSTTLKGRQV